MKLSGLVDPHHPVVSRLAAQVDATADGDAERVLTQVCDLLSHWRMLGRFGPADYNDVERQRAGNCIDFATIACATQRRLGVKTAYVLLGAERQSFPAVMHTWMVTADAHRWYLVDPRDWKVVPHDPADIENTLTVSALFNDTDIAMTTSDRSRVWAAEL